MKNNKYLFVLLLLLSILIVAVVSTFCYVKLNDRAELQAGDAQEDFVIMTSCNPVYIATLNVAGGIDGVTVSNLSQPTTGCLHDYTLTTADMRSLAQAGVLVINGSGMEGYLSDVMEAYPELPIVDSSEDLSQVLMEEDEVNSHFWLSTSNYYEQVSNIAAGLAALDSAHAEDYLQNAEDYIDSLKDSQMTAYFDQARTGVQGRKCIVLHEALAYMAEDLGMEVIGCMDLDEERQISAGEVADLVDVIDEAGGPVIILSEKDYGQSMVELLEKQCANVYNVYIETLIHGSCQADSYEKKMKANYSNIDTELLRMQGVELGVE